MIFFATLNQMAYLFALIALGYLIMKLKLVPENSDSVLSKLENYIFIPALVLGIFAENFTPEKLLSSGYYLLGSLAIEIIVIPLSLLCVKLCTKDKYIQKIYLYGLCFSNFGFMGNAIISTMFPGIFLEYVIFTLVLWVIIYIWGVPVLLMGDENKKGLVQTAKNFVNPLFICVFIGAFIGLSGIRLPKFASTLITSAGNCMSPVSMLITGMIIAKMDLFKILRVKSIYVVSVLRLIVFPVIFIAVYNLAGKTFDSAFVICAVASLAMPLGLNTIVIPSAYGKDTSIASGMALISHFLSIATIPLIFSLMPA